MSKAANLELIEVQNKLGKKLSPYRFQHSIGVQYTAAALAMKYNIDINKALLAGLLHDCAKYLSGEEIYEKCVKYGIEITKEEEAQPHLLHGKLGAYYAKEKYGVTDEDILNAITYHTTGRPNMSLLEKILYIADYIEPNRKVISGLDEIRRYAFDDIDKAVVYKIKNMNGYLLSKDIKLEGISLDTYNYYIG
ncbi:MAG: HD domain-containing protein [Lachnospiraceae bacterium]|nr:HD domain-containing protein [Lachnospiraceae bacterium]